MLKKKTLIFEYELPIEIESQKPGGYLAACPAWQDCYAQGDTIDEAVLEITAVAKSLIELYKEEGLKIPLKIPSTKIFTNPFTVPVIIAA